MDFCRIQRWQNYKVAMEYLIKKHNPDIILFGATVIGAELAPSVATKMRTGLAAHCVDITAEKEKVSFWVLAFGGNVIGVSGATHHVCGMNNSKTIIIINKDSNAKIFEISDYKVVAKSEAILTALLEKI